MPPSSPATSPWQRRQATPLESKRSREDYHPSVTTPSAIAGDEVPSGAQCIEVRVPDIRRLFNAIDPSPFRDRDLDPAAEAFIVDWRRDLPVDVPLALVVYLEHAPHGPEEATMLRDAVHQYFRQRAIAARRSLRSLFRRGRVSLAIGLGALTLSIAVGDALGATAGREGFRALLSESVLIGGWVAMWRPLEVFLYDWWPIRADARLYDRLSVMPVRLVYTTGQT